MPSFDKGGKGGEGGKEGKGGKKTTTEERGKVPFTRKAPP